MSVFTQAEITAATFIRDWFKNNKTEIEQDAHPVEVIVENGVLKLADAFFAKLGPVVGGAVDALFQKYLTLFEGHLDDYVGQGVDVVVNYLNALIAKLQAQAA